MIDVLTVTMHPALDVSTSTGQVTHSHKLRCTATVLHTLAGGVNSQRLQGEVAVTPV